MLTQAFAEALAEAEKIIAGAPFIASEQDLAEGYDYLAGSIQASLRLAWAYQRDFPYFVQSTGPYTKMGLDNPDTLYFHAYLRDDAEYVVTGRRGSTADLSFQVLKGDYSPVEVPDSLSAFDDRAIEIGADGTFELRFGPLGRRARTTSGSAPGRRCCWSARSTATGPPNAAARSASAARTGPGWAPPPADTPGDGQALRRGRQDPAVPAAHVPGLPRVVLPEGAGQHDDAAAADAGRPGHPVLLGRPLRPGRGPGDDRDGARGRPGRGALPGHPARQHVVRLAGLHQPPDQPDRRPGPHRPGPAAALRDQRARPRRGQLAGAHRAAAWLRADPLATADPGPHRGGRAAGGGGPVHRDRRTAALLRPGAGVAAAMAGADRRAPGRRGGKDAG